MKSKLEQYITDLLSGDVWITTEHYKLDENGDTVLTGYSRKQAEIPPTLLAAMFKESQVDKSSEQLNLFTIEVVKVEPEAL